MGKLVHIWTFLGGGSIRKFHKTHLYATHALLDLYAYAYADVLVFDDFDACYSPELSSGSSNHWSVDICIYIYIDTHRGVMPMTTLA